MRKKLIPPFVFFMGLVSTKMHAQKLRTLIGGNVMIGSPTGDFKNFYTRVTGVEGSIGKGFSKLYVIGTIGYQAYKEADGFVYGKMSLIPMKAGIRIYPTEKIFICGNAGYGFLKDETMTFRDTRFVYDAGAGLNFLLGQISIHYDAWQRRNNPGTSASVLLKVGLVIK
jgi:hypothetical protein